MSSNDSSPPSKKPSQPPGAGQAGAEFSIDHDESIQLEIPTVTKLLNRKKLEIGEKSEAPRPQIRGAQRADRRSGKRLEVLVADAPSGQAVGLAEGLARSLRAATGAAWVLLLTPIPNAGPQSPPEFEARSILGGDRALWNLLTGFHWGQASSPSCYQELSMNRCFELTARSTQADAKALRAALAMDQALGLWMIALGKKTEAPALVLMTALADPSKMQSWLEQNELQLQKA